MNTARKTSLKADREDWGGGQTAPVVQRRRGKRHRWTRGTKGTNEPPQILRKSKESMLIHTTTHLGTTRDHPRSHKTTFHWSSQNKGKHQTTRAGARAADPGTTKISRLDSPQPPIFFGPKVHKTVKMGTLNQQKINRI